MKLTACLVFLLAFIAAACAPDIRISSPAPRTGPSTPSGPSSTPAPTSTPTSTPAPLQAHAPQVWVWHNLGAARPGEMQITTRLVDNGWDYEVDEIRIKHDILFRPDAIVVHLPWGFHVQQMTNPRGDGYVSRINPSLPTDMHFDSLLYAKEIPSLARVTNEAAFVQAWQRYHRAVGPERIWFYLGGPQYSPRLRELWEQSDRAPWRDRVDASVQPIRRLRDAGVPVGIIIDNVIDGGGPQMEALAEHLRARGFLLGGEPRMRRNEAAWNRSDTPIVTTESAWNRFDPSKHEDSRNLQYIPNDELLGRQCIVIWSGVDAMIEHLRAGRTVLVGVWRDHNGRWSTHPYRSAAELKAAAGRGSSAR